MDYGLLISAVEGHKCLYDKRDPNYKNLLLKDKAWEEIFQITGMSKDDCKKRRNLLREKFNKEIKKRDLPSGSGKILGDEWPYIESLMFLKEFIQPRKTKSNNFENQIEFAEDVETDNSILESPLKRQKPNQFGDTIETFNDILAEFKDRHNATRPESSEIDIDEQFCKTLILFYRGFPEYVKDEARVRMITTISDLRTKYLGDGLK